MIHVNEVAQILQVFAMKFSRYRGGSAPSNLLCELLEMEKNICFTK